MRTLFVGEDTSRRNNDYVWAYNVDTGKLCASSRYPARPRRPACRCVENLNGYGYVMSHFQHPGEASQMVNPGDAALLDLLNQALGAKPILLLAKPSGDLYWIIIFQNLCRRLQCLRRGNAP